MNRTGKIARQPENIRQELNERLSNGEAGGSLVPWLNGLPEVQAIIDAEFDGAPIREQNISEWRRGGYLDWLNAEDAFEVVHRLQDGGAEFQDDEKEEDADVSAAMEHYLLSRQALNTKRAESLEGKEKWALWERMCLELMRIHQGEMQAGKLALAEERLAWKKEIELELHAAAPAERAWEVKSRARAAAARRGEFTEEESTAAREECDRIFKSESEATAEHYRKLREDAEDADYRARGEIPPDRDYEIDWGYGLFPPYPFRKTERCLEREAREDEEMLARGETPPKRKPEWVTPRSEPPGQGEVLCEWFPPGTRARAEADARAAAEKAAAEKEAAEKEAAEKAAAEQAAAPAPAPPAEVEDIPYANGFTLEEYFRRTPRPPGWRPPIPHRPYG